MRFGALMGVRGMVESIESNYVNLIGRGIL